MKTRRLDNYGKINKDKNISFTWENKKIFGFEGDSLASALLANNVLRKARTNAAGSSLTAVPFSTKGRSGKSSAGMPRI